MPYEKAYGAFDCPRCGSDVVPVAGGYRCTVCGHFIPSSDLPSTENVRILVGSPTRKPPVGDEKHLFFDTSNNIIYKGTGTGWSSFVPTYNVVTKTSNYTASNGDCILADASSGAITITLPSPSNNAIVNVKKIDSSTNAVTVEPNGSETIDGSSSKTIDTQYESYTFISDGTNWYII